MDNTIDAADLIAQARAAGLTLSLRNGNVNVNGTRTPAVDALLAKMKPHKPAIVAALEAELSFTLADVEPPPVDPLPPPMIMRSKRPPLPAEMWLNGLPPAQALAAHATLKQHYFCTVGSDSAGWYVRCDPKHYRKRAESPCL